MVAGGYPFGEETRFDAIFMEHFLTFVTLKNIFKTRGIRIRDLKVGLIALFGISLGDCGRDGCRFG